MIYSSWDNNSYWYTHRVPDTDQFVIEDYKKPVTFTYDQITKDIMGCLEKVQCSHFEPTQSELHELKSYMEQFVKDMEV